MIIQKSKGDKLFDILNTLGMALIIFVTLYPFWFALIGSLNEGTDYARGGVNLLIRKFTLDNYKVVFSDGEILSAFKVTIARTLVGTSLHVLVTALFAYGFSRKYLLGKKAYATMGLITMYFSGGLIPFYLLLKALGLIDNFLVYILPGLFSFYQVLIFQAFFREIPEAINESAKMDGAGEYRIFFSLIIPLSAPVLAAVTLFAGVHHWNSFFDSMVYTTKRELQVIQLVLIKIIQTKEQAQRMVDIASAVEDNTTSTSDTVQLATMMVTTAPIIMLYPFLQKYFVKGIMIGSVKG